MKSAHQVAADLVTGLTDPKTQEPDTNRPSKESMAVTQKFERLMERFWGKMMSTYGIQWERSYGHVDGEAFAEWSASLMYMPPMKIKAGLDLLLTDPSLDPSFPPNMIKFLRLCRAAPEPVNQAKQLPPPVNRNTASNNKARDKCIAEAKGLLGHWESPK